MSVYTKADLKDAKWISADGACEAPLFRGVFELPKVRKASVTIAGLGIYEMHINGKRVGEDLFLPLNTDFHERENVMYCGYPFEEQMRHRLYCPVYDVTALLLEGINTFCFLMGPGWYKNPFDHSRNGYGEVKGCYLLEYEDAAGELHRVGSDETHKWHEGFVKRAHINCGESQDYRDYEDCWMEPGFDDVAWEPVKIMKAPETNLYLQDCPSDRIVRHVVPHLVFECGDCKIYDVGENLTGYPIFRSYGESGEVIQVRYGEELAEDGTLDEKHIYNQYTEFVSDGPGRIMHLRFTWCCFRYFEVKGKATVEDCVVIHSDVDVTSSFLSDNEVLNWLRDAYVRTQLANLHCGIPSDCPHVERLGYTGDGQITCKAAMLQLDTKVLYRKWIYDIADCQDRVTGHVQYTAPFYPAGGGPGGFACAIVTVPWTYYEHYGDMEPLRDLYPQMLHWFDSLEDHSKEELIVSDRPGVWCLGEWSVPSRGQNELDDVLVPAPYVNTYFYIKCMEIVLKIGKLLGIHENDDWLKERIARKKQVLIKRYYEPETGNFAGNVQGSNAYAVDLELVEDERTFSNMVAHYRETKVFDTGIFGTDLLTRLLFEKNEEELALTLLTGKGEQTFYRQMAEGATTLWEHWYGLRSRCHPMHGAVTRYLFEYILGIRQAEGSVAYKDLVIEPKCQELVRHASGHITAGAGEISVAYDEYKINVSIPTDTRAVLRLNGREYLLKSGTETTVLV